ncbi:DNA replication ATP-dependent helicase/nuclease DNA2 [Epargyreus clarus]|uniref:DNA replication ATP-dependent helicase/nuclease DNA2 n=1 Tax=Epargyreus clarus TaxID=520877 RepID=UPI003C2F1181
MPKALSLKRSSLSTKNNQKPITQFFKSGNINGSQAQNGYTNKDHEKDDKPTNKRKADSPVQCTSQYFDKPNGALNCNDAAESYSKKQKCELDRELSKNNIEQTSFDLKISPEKNNVSLKSHTLDSNNIEEEKHRLPLSTIKLDIYNDKTDIQLSNTNLNGKSSEKENGYSTELKTHKSPTKSSPNKNIHSPSKRKNHTPTKKCKDSISPKISRRTPQKTPDKHIELSPSKCGSTVKVLTFSQNDIEDIFDDDWDVANEEDMVEDLDLSTMQRCEVLSVTQHPTRLELRLKNDSNNRGTCFVEGIWINTPLQVGEIVSILATRDSSGQFVITNSSGLLSLRPDHLISTTSVVAGVFCKRKAVLQERWRGIDAANTAMTIGILIHELVQAALTRHIVSTRNLQSEADTIISQSTQMLYDAGLTVEETRTNMQLYIAPLAEFMQLYVKANTGAMQRQKGQWNGNIDEVLDIEENVCCPKLGLKGKIDATLQVTIHERSGKQRAIVPLELKSGKASMSAEHRGQLVLYCMMLGLQRKEDPASALQRGLLLYLRDRIDLREVSCGYPERRDLIMLRNELVQHLATGPKEVDTDQLVDIEEAASLLQQSLPDPVHNENACTKCPYLTACSLHLWHTTGPTVSERHPLTKLRSAALGHLSPKHIKYFLHWSSLLRLEEKEQIMTSPLHALWTDSVEKRAKRGTCASNLRLKSVASSGDRYEHVFEKENNIQKESKNERNGPQDGDFSIVSIDDRPWIAAGPVILSNEKEIRILLERDLSRRLNKDTKYHIDTYESYATTVQNLTNLGVLMEDSDRALRLRKIIVDAEAAQFAGKLPRAVGRLGARLLRPLNLQQQRAVLRALAAHDYALLRGLPGTGKTQTISVLIQMLVGLQQRVLVTAHTHSAVDTVLSRLPDTIKVMRLGSSSRVAASLQSRCEDQLTKSCNTPELLAELYDSMEVVGVTCLGAAHAMLTRTTFDVCIVDEATQVLQSTVLRPLFACKRFVLVGDPDQLPPVVRSRTARRLGMEESLFHRLMSEQAVSTLHLQYRMNQALVDVANLVAYDAKLKCADENVAKATLNLDMQKISQLYNNESWLLAACSPELAHSAVFLSMPSICTRENNASKNLTNIDESCVVLEVVKTLKEGGVLSSDVGIIAPYRDQVSFLRRSLAHLAVEVSTVDQFQGRDKSVIIYSCTKRDDGKDDKKVKEGEVLNDKRRLAVSVTRAKHKLIVIGNNRALRRYDILQPLIEACKQIPIQESDVHRLFDKYKEFVS